MPNLTSLRDFWRSLEPRAQLTLVISLLAVAATMYGVYHFASKPSYTTLQTGLTPATTGRVTDALASAGVSYKIENGGTALAVRDGQQDEAQVALGKAGVSASGHDGFDLFNKSSLSTTQFQQDVNYQRALEGTIATNIEAIDGADAAQVQLVLPKDQLFQDERSSASAAVLITAPLGLDASSVRGIAHLVSSSVPGLDPEHVTITDQTGQMLWPTGDGGGAGGTPTKLQAQQTYAAQLSSQIDAFLVRTLGPGKAEARVNVDLDLDETSLESMSYGDKKVPLQQNTTKETLKGGGGSAGAAGTPSNIPPGYAAGAGAGAGSNYNSTSEQVTNGADWTRTKSVVAPGTVNKLDVALLFDSTVKGESVAAVNDAVSSMLGLDPSRGDQLPSSTIQFAKLPAAGSSGGGIAGMGSPLDLGKKAAAGIGVLAFLFLVRRSLKRRESDPVAPEPRWLREIQQTTPLAALGPGPLDVSDLQSERRKGMQAAAEDLVRRNPDQVAMQVATWMNE